MKSVNENIPVISLLWKCIIITPLLRLLHNYSFFRRRWQGGVEGDWFIVELF